MRVGRRLELFLVTAVLADTNIGAAIFIRDPDGQLLELLPMSYREQLRERPLVPEEDEHEDG